MPLPGDGKIVRPMDSAAGRPQYSSSIGDVHWQRKHMAGSAGSGAELVERWRMAEKRSAIPYS